MQLVSDPAPKWTLKLFANRDYVYNRRTFVDRKRQVIVIANRSTQHPKCPIKATNQRVSDYWSYMVIKPNKSFGRPGLRFVLTYFDDPGIVIPPTVTSWVAKKQMPDFLNRLYDATLKYAQKRRDEEVEAINRMYSYEKLRDPGYEYPPDPEVKETGKDDDTPSSPSSSSSGGQGRSILEDLNDEEEEQESEPKSKSWWRLGGYATPTVIWKGYPQHKDLQDTSNIFIHKSFIAIL
uniref:Uncharacterized protein n=1 Tax=Phlebotomus papatasi TaxID=29031 RepID=A0A1B0DP32_PHLPP